MVSPNNYTRQYRLSPEEMAERLEGMSIDLDAEWFSVTRRFIPDRKGDLREEFIITVRSISE